MSDEETKKLWHRSIGHLIQMQGRKREGKIVKPKLDNREQVREKEKPENSIFTRAITPSYEDSATFVFFVVVFFRAFKS